jgi:hypothetical protein
MFNLTSFLFTYNAFYDYGAALKGLCKKEYFEYESSRFQIADNIHHIKLQNNNFQYYKISVLIMSILISLLVTIAFTVLVYKSFYNMQWLCDKLEIETSASSISKFFKVILQSIAKWRLFDSKYIVIIIFVFFTYLVLLAVPAIWMTYVVLKLTNSLNGPFWSDPKVYIAHSVLFSIIVVMRLMIYVVPSLLIDYAPKSEAYHFLVFIGIMVLYIASFYIMDTPEEQIDESKTIDNPASFYSSIFNMKSATILSVIGIMIVVLCLLYVPFMSGSESDQQFIKYTISLVLVILIVAVAVSNVVHFNSAVNKIILEEPVKTYKDHIKKVNNIFNDVLYIEHQKVEADVPEYICRNVGNAILMPIYSKLFNGVSKHYDITPEFLYDKKCENIEPFVFNKKECQSTKSCKFNEENEYDVSYYLNAKSKKKNIFYKFNECTKLDIDAIKKMSENTSNLLESEQIMKSISNILDNKVYYSSNIDLKIVDEKEYNTIGLLESYKNNNSLSIQNWNKIDVTSHIYQSKVDKIVKEYNEMRQKLYDILSDQVNAIGKNEGKNIDIDPRLEPTIVNGFNKINSILSASLNDNIVNNDITKYIISNYNAIVLNNDDIYKKKVFMTSNIGSAPVDDSNIMIDLFTKLDYNYNKLNILYDKLYQKDLFYYNTNVDKVGSIISDVKIPSTIKSDVLTVTPQNYVISSNVTCLLDVCLQKCVDENKLDNCPQDCVDNRIQTCLHKCRRETVHCIVVDILDKEKLVYNSIKKFYQLEYKTPIDANDSDAITQKETAIKDSQDAITTNLENIDKNLRSLKIDINNKNKSGKSVDVSVTSTRKDALAMKDKVQRVNELIYILGLNYVILFLLPILIVSKL